MGSLSRVPLRGPSPGSLSGAAAPSRMGLVPAPHSLSASPREPFLAFSHPISPPQVPAVRQHVRRVPPRGEGALRLVPGLQPRRPPAAHHEVAGDQLPLPRGLRPPLRVHLSPATSTGATAGWGTTPRVFVCIYFGGILRKGSYLFGGLPVPLRVPFCTELNQTSLEPPVIASQLHGGLGGVVLGDRGASLNPLGVAL